MAPQSDRQTDVRTNSRTAYGETLMSVWDILYGRPV